MDNDLDAFFDDVENAVRGAQQTAAEDDGNINVTETAFVAASGAKDGTTGGTASETAELENEQRQTKRARVTTASTMPVKSVVASSVPVISIAPPLPAGPPPALATPDPRAAAASGGAAAIPPPPPPNNSSLKYHTASQVASTNHHPPPPPPLPSGTASRPHVRSAAGETWTDPTLAQWPPNDFRLFVGNLARDLKQHHLEQHFGKYPSFAMARVMYNKSDGKSRGYGFVSLLDPKECARAIREMDQSWLGSRPIKVKLSEWKDRDWKEVKKRGKAEKRKKKHFGL